MAISEREVLEALKAVEDPDLRRDIVTLGFIKELVMEGDQVAFTIELTTPACPARDQIASQARQAVSGAFRRQEGRGADDGPGNFPRRRKVASDS